MTLHELMILMHFGRAKVDSLNYNMTTIMALSKKGYLKVDDPDDLYSRVHITQLGTAVLSRVEQYISVM